jgi:hypothetical protein
MPPSSESTADLVCISPHQALFGSWAAAVLIDIVVLNLIIEFVPSITIDSFYISILTACLFRLLLGVTLQIEHRLTRYFRSKHGRAMRIVGALAAYLVLFASKFVILEAVDRVFGGRVDLGGLGEVILISLTLLASEIVFRRVYEWLAKH